MKTDPPKLKLNTRMLRIDADDELFSSAQYNIKPEIVRNLIMGISRMEWSVWISTYTKLYPVKKVLVSSEPITHFA